MGHIQTNNSKAEQVRKMRDRTEPVDRQQEYWTDEELQRLETMFYEGVGITDIALELGRSEIAIFNRVKGFYRRVRAPRQSKAECLCRRCPSYVAETHECRRPVQLIKVKSGSGKIRGADAQQKGYKKTKAPASLQNLHQMYQAAFGSER